MRIPTLAVPFRYFQKDAAEIYDGEPLQEQPPSSNRLVNYPILSKHFPPPKQTAFSQPWRSKVTYADASRVTDHLADLHSRTKPHGVVGAAAPVSAAPPGMAQQYAAPPAEPEYAGPEDEPGYPPQPSARLARRW